MATDPYFDIRSVSQSSLKLFMKSPVEYHWQYVLGNGGGVNSSATSLGSLTHCMLLEPQEVERRYKPYRESERPEQDKTMASNRNKAWKLEVESTCKAYGLQCTSEAVWQQADTMVQVLCAHPAAIWLFPTEGWVVHKELDVHWRSDCSDLDLKSKLDVLLVDVAAGKAIVVDYKTTSCTGKSDFQWSIKRYGYDIQAAFYKDAALSYLQDTYPGTTFTVQVYFIPQKSAPPYQVLGVFELDARTMLAAKESYERALQELEGCYHTGNWQEAGGVEILQLSKSLDDIFLPETELLL